MIDSGKVESHSILRGREILIGVTGGVRAVEAHLLCRSLLERGALPTVVLTKEALGYVTARAFETIVGPRVAVDRYTPPCGADVSHIDLADRSECIVVYPATRDTIARVACGIADDLLTSLLMAVKVPVILALTEEIEHMPWEGPYEEALRAVRLRGFVTRRSLDGAPHEEIDGVVARIEDLLSPKDLSGARVMVTAGRTEEDIDPVRFISNRSSGKMGYAIARAADQRGGEVILIHGPTHLDRPEGVTDHG